MKYILIVFSAWLFLCCNNPRIPEQKQVDVIDSLNVFKSALAKMKDAGFELNPLANENDLFDQWKNMLVYHADAIDALYIVLGERDEKSNVFFSNDCWHFDIASIESHGSYATILENIKRISKNDLNFEHVDDYCNDKEDEKAWVSFLINGEKYKWDLKVDKQYPNYADAYLFDKIQMLCKKYNKKGRLTFFPEGQACVISYLTNADFERIKKITNLKLEWLKVGNGQFY